jgi:DNA-binding CsgD family transcriptional regulator
MAVAAPAEALRHLEEALSLWDRVPSADALVGQPRWRLGLRAAAAASGSGEYGRAVALARASRRAVDADLEPLVVAEIDERLAYYLLETDGYDEAVRLGEEALALVPAEPPSRLRATVLAGHARTLLNAHRYDESAEVADEALVGARAVGSAADEAEALTTLAMLAERAGDPAVSESLLLQSRAVAERGNDATVHVRVLHNLVTAPFERGELTLALARAKEGLEFAERHGLALSGWGLQLKHYAHSCYFQLGDWDAAAALTSESDRVSGLTSAYMVTFGCQTLVARGDARAFPQLARVRPFWGEDALLAHLAGCVAVELATWRTDYDRASELTEAAISLVSRAWPHSLALVRHAALGLSAEADRAALARAIADQTGVGQAAAAGERLLAVAEDAMAKGAGRTGAPGVEAQAWWARVQAEKSRLDGVNDPALWQGSVEAFTFGADTDVYETARGQWRLAEALAQAGHRDDAAEQWRRSHEVATRLGATPLLKALDDLRRRARLAGSAEQVPDAGLTLTPRELEVLRLVAEGRSNRQIGAALYISDKTASVHVSNLMAKLGATSRTEAAAVAYRSGVLSPPS